MNSPNTPAAKARRLTVGCSNQETQPETCEGNRLRFCVISRLSRGKDFRIPTQRQGEHHD